MLIQQLPKTAKKIGAISHGDCSYEHSCELWKDDQKFYEREYYYAADDDGFDEVSEISEKEALSMQQCSDFSFVCNSIFVGSEFDEKAKKWRDTYNKDFIKFYWNNRNLIKAFAKKLFENDWLKAAEYLYAQ